jgi:transposase
MIRKEDEVEILRLWKVEKWKIDTIAKQLGLHHETVERVIEQDGTRPAAKPRPSMLDPYVPFIVETLEKYPRIGASRLFVMCQERGYPGQEDHFRHLIRRLRPPRRQEAFLRLKTLPGEQGQVDWAHFGRLRIGRAERQLMAFVLVLSFSRAIFFRFFLGQCLENFLRGHEAAFHAWSGLPRVLLYDNLKTVVLERRGDAIRFHPTFLDFAAHYCFEPRPVAVGRGNEKPRVERAIRFIRESFFTARAFRSLEHLNEQAWEWCHGRALDRPWPDDKQRRVREVFEGEKPLLLPLPAASFPTDERREVTVRKTPYVRFDLNDYSLPHVLTGETVTVLASLETVRIFHGPELMATHRRSWGQGEQIEDRRHIEALVAAKREARKHRAIDRLVRAAPSTEALMLELAQRGQSLQTATKKLLELLDGYGAERLERAVREALRHQAPHPHAVRHLLEKARQEEGKPPLVPIDLSEDPRIRDLTVRPHDLATYDELRDRLEEEDDDDQTAVPV